MLFPVRQVHVLYSDLAPAARGMDETVLAKIDADVGIRLAIRVVENQIARA